MCESGAFASAFVYLCRNLGRRLLKRSIRDCEDGGRITGSVVYCRVYGLRRICGGRGTGRRRVLRSIMVFSTSSIGHPPSPGDSILNVGCRRSMASMLMH